MATVFYALGKFYKLPAREAARRLLALASLEVEEVEPLALEAQEEGVKVLSFDRGFVHWPGLWEEPQWRP